MSEQAALVIVCTIGAAFLGFFFKVFFDWIKHGRNGNGGGQKKCRCVHTKDFQDLEEIVKIVQKDTAWMKEAHDSRDADGMLRWYFPRSIGEELKKLNGRLEGLPILMKSLLKETQTHNKTIEILLKKQG